MNICTLITQRVLQPFRNQCYLQNHPSSLPSNLPTYVLTCFPAHLLTCLSAYLFMCLPAYLLNLTKYLLWAERHVTPMVNQSGSLNINIPCGIIPISTNKCSMIQESESSLALTASYVFNRPQRYGLPHYFLFVGSDKKLQNMYSLEN